MRTCNSVHFAPCKQNLHHIEHIFVTRVAGLSLVQLFLDDLIMSLHSCETGLQLLILSLQDLIFVLQSSDAVFRALLVPDEMSDAKDECQDDVAGCFGGIQVDKKVTERVSRLFVLMGGVWTEDQARQQGVVFDCTVRVSVDEVSVIRL